MLDAIELTQKLVGFRTDDPRTGDDSCAEYAAKLLERLGFVVHRQKFGAGRMNVVARLLGEDADAPCLAMTGHLDTVPLGAAEWSVDPFGGEVRGGRLFGRGSSDMKAGVAAIISAAAEGISKRRRRGLTLILTDSEETGALGAAALVTGAQDVIGRACALVVGEPTGNRIAVGHKGCLCLRARFRGVTAHSAMPHLGVNAIYKAARAITAVEGVRFEYPSDSLLGAPTINVGTMSGGLNTNSVPDFAEFTIDMRSTARTSHADLRRDMLTCVGAEAEFETVIDLPAVATDAANRFVLMAMAACRRGPGEESEPGAVAFYTDASVLQPYLGCPTIILGPGETAMAHQTDEYCEVGHITRAHAIYADMIGEVCEVG